MAFDDACHVCIGFELDIKFVANLVELAVWGKVFVQKVEELLADNCLNFHLVWEIKPGNVLI